AQVDSCLGLCTDCVVARRITDLSKRGYPGVGRGCGVGRGLGFALCVAVGDGVATGVGVAVGIGVPVGLGVGVVPGPCTSNEPMSIRPLTTLAKPGPRWSKRGGGVKFGSPALIAGLPGNSACVNVGPPLSSNGPSSGSVRIWSPGPVRNPPPSSLQRLKPLDVTVPVLSKILSPVPAASRMVFPISSVSSLWIAPKSAALLVNVLLETCIMLRLKLAPPSDRATLPLMVLLV